LTPKTSSPQRTQEGKRSRLTSTCGINVSVTSTSHDYKTCNKNNLFSDCQISVLARTKFAKLVNLEKNIGFLSQTNATKAITTLI
jgi:hypothetical protein